MRINLRRIFSRRLVEIVLALLICSAGYLAGVATQPHLPLQISFDDKVNPVELLSFVATIVLAWVISFVLEKRKQADVAVKELLLKRVETLQAFVADTARQAVSGDYLYVEATSALKKIQVAASRICSLLESKQFACDPDIKTNIDSCAESLIELMTDTPPLDLSREVPQPIRLIEGKLVFNEERTLEIERTFDDLEHNILVLALFITSL